MPNDIKLAKSYRDTSQLEKAQLNESPEPEDGALIERAFNFVVDELEAGVNDGYVRLYMTLLFCINGKIMARYGLVQPSLCCRALLDLWFVV